MPERGKLRLLYGWVLAIILLLGVAGGTFKIMHDGGKTPADPSSPSTKQGYRWQ